ncbi:hypothetical protein [Pediococcus pentosaceus]|uniref:hypothetical protein n=1 Tax=Pediococcus pentosaceus TaxID=1255 RepID=UPI00039C5557
MLEILHDLIDAQNNGQNAEDYFGKNPQTLADEILQLSLYSYILDQIPGVSL